MSIMVSEDKLMINGRVVQAEGAELGVTVVVGLISTVGSYTAFVVNFGKRKVKMFLLPCMVSLGYPSGILVSVESICT